MGFVLYNNSSLSTDRKHNIRNSFVWDTMSFVLASVSVLVWLRWGRMCSHMGVVGGNISSLSSVRLFFFGTATCTYRNTNNIGSNRHM